MNRTWCGIRIDLQHVSWTTLVFKLSKIHALYCYKFLQHLVFVSSAILSMPWVGDLGRSRIHLKEKVGSFLFLGVKNYNMLNSKKGLNTCEIYGYN